jgi:hypothetical protein
MADKKQMMGPAAWARHEEKMARKHAELRVQGVGSCDVGFGPGLLAYGEEIPREAFMPVATDMAEGMSVVNLGGHRVYIYRRKNAADIMLREEAVAWFGEEAVQKIDALIGG